MVCGSTGSPARWGNREGGEDGVVFTAVIVEVVDGESLQLRVTAAALQALSAYPSRSARLSLALPIS